MRISSLALLLALTPALAGTDLLAQEPLVPDGEYVYPQKQRPAGVDNYRHNVYYNSGKKAYNLRGLTMAKADQQVRTMKVNPSGTSFVVLEQDRKGQSTLSVYDLWKAGKRLHRYKKVRDISAVAYTPDARHIAYATPGKVTFSDARTYVTADEFPLEEGAAVSEIVFSPDGRTMALVNGRTVNVYDLESRTLRKSLPFMADVTDLEFSHGNDALGILTSDGTLNFYDTARYMTMGAIDGLGLGSSMSFNPDDKYVSVVTGDNRIALINRLDTGSREYVDAPVGGLGDARFVRDGKGDLYLAYTTASGITYKLMNHLSPNFSRLLADELDERMNEWMKMMPGETLEEYNLRVNEESRMEQMRLFEQEISTRLADDLVRTSAVTLGSYSPEAGVLSINFDNMPTMYLTVPEDELNFFTNADDIEFRNAKYALTDGDKFELIYAEVYNKNTGKTYTFDNLERQSLSYLAESDSFVPLELVQQSNLEEIKLQDIKDNVVSLAKEQADISDHTHFNVASRVANDYNAQGDRIINYKIDFSYEVDPGFSAQEDFAPGKYVVEDSSAARSMLDIIKTALETDFAQYVQPGKRLSVKVTGMADALPIKGRIAYNGAYGDFHQEPVYKNGDLTAITITKGSGITDNDQLAFLRATGVKEYIDTRIDKIDQMQVDYRTDIEVNEEEGGEFRRIKVEMTFIDPFDNNAEK